MRKSILLCTVSCAALAVSGCTHMTTAQKVDFGCELAVLAAQTTGTVAQVAVQHGADPAKAQKLADRAAAGESVVTAICLTANAVAPEL